jgi:predicted Zn-dependent protease
VAVVGLRGRFTVLKLVLLACVAGLSGVGLRCGAQPIPASASPTVAPSALPLVRPRAVVLHVHSDVTDQQFLPELVRRLRAALAPALHTLPTTFDLKPLRSWTGIVDGQAIAGALIGSVDWKRDAATVQVLLIADDLRLKPANFSLAVSNGTAATPHHIVIVSLHRLQQVGLLDRATDRNPARTAERAFKLILKNVARVSGYAASNLCVFGFPRSVDELDALPEGFCEPDRTLLVNAGIARP